MKTVLLDGESELSAAVVGGDLVIANGDSEVDIALSAVASNVERVIDVFCDPAGALFLEPGIDRAYAAHILIPPLLAPATGDDVAMPLPELPINTEAVVAELRRVPSRTSPEPVPEQE